MSRVKKVCTLLLLGAFTGLYAVSTNTFGQGTDFFGFPTKKKVAPKKQVSKPKPLPRTVPTPKPVPKPEVPTKQKTPSRQSLTDVIFLLDTSGSMDSPFQGQDHSKLDAAKEALSFFARNMDAGTRFQLWSFNFRLTQHPHKAKAGKTNGAVVFKPIGVPGSEARGNLLKTISSLETSGGTNLYQSVFKAIRYFQSSLYQVPGGGRRYKVLVVLADGQDDGISGISLNHVLAAKSAAPKVKIRTIGFGITPSDPLHQILCRMASGPESCTISRDAGDLREIITSFSRG